MEQVAVYVVAVGETGEVRQNPGHAGRSSVKVMVKGSTFTGGGCK